MRPGRNESRKTGTDVRTESSPTPRKLKMIMSITGLARHQHRKDGPGRRSLGDRVVKGGTISNKELKNDDDKGIEEHTGHDAMVWLGRKARKQQKCG